MEQLRESTRDKELYDLVTSSVPPSPYSGLSLITALFDPINSILWLPIQLPFQGIGQELYATIATVTGNATLPAANYPNAQLEGGQTISNTVNKNTKNSKKRRRTKAANNKTNEKNHNPPIQQNGLISSENHMAIKKDMDDNVNIKPMIDKTSKVGHNKSENGDGQPGDDNQKQDIQQQQSNQNSVSFDKRFACPICSRCFGYRHTLRNHERTHSGEKPFVCITCDRRFARCHHLKAHIRCHTGEKPYNCTDCDRRFVQVANLRRHLRVHTLETPYPCEMCSYRFSDSNQLKRHMRIHKDIPSPIKRKRKSRVTRRIIRVNDKSGLESFIPIVPEQIHPEDLSLSGSYSSVSGSPTSPTSEGLHHESLGPFSVSSSKPASMTAVELQHSSKNE